MVVAQLEGDVDAIADNDIRSGWRRRPAGARVVDFRTLLVEAPPPRDLRVAELAQEHYRHEERRGRRGLRTLRSWAASHVPAFWRETRARDVGTPELLAYLEAMDLSGFAPSTTRSYVSHLSRAYERGLLTGAVETNPIRELPRGVLPAPRPRDPLRPADEVLTFGEVRRIVLASDDEVPFYRRLAWTTLLLTGMRIGELAELRFGDLHRRTPLGAIVVARSWDCRDRVVHVTKTDLARRHPIHPILADYIAEARAMSGRILGRPVGPADLIAPFPSQRGLTRWHETTALRLWRRDLRALGIEDPICGPRRVHATKHTFCTLATELGADPKTVEAITHTPDLRSGESCFALYRHFTWEALCRAVQVFQFDEIPKGAGVAGEGNCRSQSCAEDSCASA